MQRKIVYFKLQSGEEPYLTWFNCLKDEVSKGRIFARIERVRDGNLGDHKWLSKGVGELRLHFGSGYRIYFGLDGLRIIVLLVAGDKSTQSEDIKKAVEYFAQYQKEKNA